MNRNAEYAGIHKVSRSCSPKGSDLNLELNEEEQHQSIALQKKRERYHSQRRRADSSRIINNTSKPCGDQGLSSQRPIITAKRIPSSKQSHDLGEIL